MAFSKEKSYTSQKPHHKLCFLLLYNPLFKIWFCDTIGPEMILHQNNDSSIGHSGH